MDGLTIETCRECGFDARDWQVRDAVTLLAALGFWWRLATDGIDAGDLHLRPAPGVWSAVEYAAHSAIVTAVLREGIGRILLEDGVALASAPHMQDAAADDEPAATLNVPSLMEDLEREGKALAALAKKAEPDAWSHVGRMPDESVQALAAVLHAVHDATHHQMDVGRGLAAIGAGTPPGSGRVARVNASDGGVPKRAVDGGRIDWHGLAGDRQADRFHHGRPFQALCLWSTEVIDELAAAGHPIGPGGAGENLTLSGLDWSALRPGARLRLGTALAEISFPAVPCAKQTRWFSDGDFGRIAHERNPQWVRWYAWVREPGDVHAGDTADLQPR